MQTFQNNGQYSPNYMNGSNGMTQQQWEQEVQRPTVATPANQWNQSMARSGIGRLESQNSVEARLGRWRDALSEKPLDLTNPMTQEQIENPMSREEVALGSLKGLLARNLGHYVVATFVVGVSDFVVWRGILHSVGNDYLVIYQPNQDRYITGDFYSLKFIEFHSTYDAILGDTPEWNIS